MKASEKYNSPEPQRLDLFLFDYLYHHLDEELKRQISRSSILKYIEYVDVNGKKEKKGFMLKEGDVVNIDVDHIIQNMKESIKTRETLLPQDGHLNIVEEGKEWLVVNKPKGLVVHPGVGNWDGTLANIIKGYLVGKGEYENGIERGGIVHRLDKGVSGLMIIAKTIKMQKFLKQQFENHEVIKVYKAKIMSFDGRKELLESDADLPNSLNAFVANKFNPLSDWIKVEGYIGRSSVDRKKMVFRPNSEDGFKYSLMYIKPLKNNELLINLKTGRMHQIRATLKYLGYFIQGDTKYGVGSSEPSSALNLEEILLGCRVGEKEFKYWLL